MIWTCGCLLAGSTLWAVEDEARAAFPRWSPFDLRRAAAPVAAADLPLEFWGFIETHEGFQYRVRDPALKVAAFVRLNVPESDLGGVVARRYDPASGALTVEHHGRILTLPERKAKVVSAGAPLNATRPPPMRNSAYPVPAVSPAVIQSVVLNPTPAQERERLDAVAAEIKRRQELRERAAREQK